MDKPIELKELISLFKNHDTVTFTLSGLGEMALETEMFKNVIEEIEELERLARIGRATERAYDEGYDLNVNINPARYRFKNIQSLLEWAESEGE